MNKKALTAIMTVSMILGFFVMLQIKSIRKTDPDTYVNKIRYEQLQDMLMTEKDKNEALYKQMLEYKDEISKYQEDAAKEDGIIEILKKDLDNAELLAGLTEVSGSGLTITLEDGDVQPSSETSENMYLIHDEDVLKVLNELKAAGAEAISLNGERIVSLSEVRCAGPTISVNNTRTAAPFVIKAIGDPNEMEGALNLRGGVVDALTTWIKIEIKTENNLVIPAYKGKMEFKYAKKVGTENEQ